MSETSRPCIRCGETKPLSAFGPNSRMRLGVESCCRACRNADAKARRDANPEMQRKNRETAATWRARNPEKVRQGRKRYYETHREEIAKRDRRRRVEKAEQLRAYHREYNLKNIEKRLEKNRKWNAANPDKYYNQRARHRARKYATRTGPVDLDALWTGSCGICDGPMDGDLKRPDPMSKSVDHIVPLSRGGTHTQDNLQWTHLRCNLRKGARPAS